jgi:peroxiredoxin
MLRSFLPVSILLTAALPIHLPSPPLAGERGWGEGVHDALIAQSSIAIPLCLSFVDASSQTNEQLKIGAPAPAWSNLPGVDGKKHALADLKEKEMVVVVFTCNSCPIAEGYEDRILSFAKKHAGTQGKVALVAINVNITKEDALPKMIERAKEKQFNFPYLFDETQQIAKAYGAVCTPEFFVLDKERKIAYMGAMDDRNDQAAAKVNFLDLAVEAVLKGGRPTIAETKPRGCLIRYERQKT